MFWVLKRTISLRWNETVLLSTHNICLGLTVTCTQWDRSFEHPKHIFKKNNAQEDIHNQYSKHNFYFLFLIFFMFFTLIFGKNFLFLILANCVCNEICREKLAPISPKGPRLWCKFIFVYTDEDLAINWVQPNFLSLLLTDKFRRCVPERVPFKWIVTRGEYTVIQWLCIA